MPAVQYQPPPQAPQPPPVQVPPPIQAPPPVAQPVAESPACAIACRSVARLHRACRSAPRSSTAPPRCARKRPCRRRLRAATTRAPGTRRGSSPSVAEPLPTSFVTRQATPAPAAAAGSAYVTAHLAALARAERAKSPPRGPIPERREDTSAWASDFQELIPREQTEMLPRPAASVPAPQRAASERRVVAPGSQGRARAGVAKSLQRCGIGEELAHELIDAAGAHALRSRLGRVLYRRCARHLPSGYRSRRRWPPRARQSS